MGSYLLGVRTDSYDLDTRLRAALDRHVADGTPANNNYSVRLHPRSDGPTTLLKALYRGHSLEVASRSRQRIVAALLAHLSAWALEERPDLLALQAVAAVGDGRAVLLPAALGCRSPVLERRLARTGLSVIDAPVVHLDKDSGAVAVEPPQLAVDAEPLDSLQDDPRPAQEGAAIPPGRYPVVCWVLPDVRQGCREPSAAEAVLRAVGLTRRGPGTGAQDVVDLLTGVFASARPLVVGGDQAGIADAVTAAVGP